MSINISGGVTRSLSLLSVLPHHHSHRPLLSSSLMKASWQHWLCTLFHCHCHCCVITMSSSLSLWSWSWSSPCHLCHHHPLPLLCCHCPPHPLPSPSSLLSSQCCHSPPCLLHPCHLRCDGWCKRVEVEGAWHGDGQPERVEVGG